MVEIQLEGTDTATALGISVKGRGLAGPICSLARALIEAGHSGDAIVKRGDVVCFEAMPLQRWADIQCRESDRASVRFYKYQPFARDVFND